jgi:hypothetical protein
LQRLRRESENNRRRIGRILGCVAACALVASGGCTAASPLASRIAAPSQRPFVLTFWCGPPLAQFDDARAAEIAAAGFNIVGAPCDGGFDAALNLVALDVAQRHGLRMWVADHRYGLPAVAAPDWPAPLAAAVADYRNHPALDGYFVADEPPVPQFESVAAAVAGLRDADPSHLAYVNLLPDYVPAEALGAPSYEDYVEQFIATVHPQLLSYDYYPFGHEKDRSTFFTNLATIRAAALRYRLPFMLIVLAMPHGPYRNPGEAELAWQAHHALAYGARGISYFTYWTPAPRGDEWDGHEGLIEDGRPTLHYFQVARLNRELRALGGALTGFASIAVADAAGEIGVPFPLGPIDAIEGGSITAGLFGDGHGRLAVLLVNRDYRYGTNAVVRLHAGAAAPEAFDAESGQWDRSGALSFVLPPGGARLLRWSE